jgi:drug/metabolite transporter (DMT)-like permease
VAAIVLALGSAICFGVSDFAAGLQARRIPLLGLMILSQSLALVILVAMLAISGAPAPDLVKLLPAAAAGVCGMIALAAFFRGLAIGAMSVVAPISSTGAAVPVLVGIASGNRPAALQVAGIVSVVVGIMLAGRQAAEVGADAKDARTSVWLALVAAAGFGAYLVAVRASAQSSVLWTLGAARLTSVLALGLAIAVRRTPLLPQAQRRGAVPALCLIGSLDLGGNLCYAVATRHGQLAIVGVVASLYPVATVLLARAVLVERVQRVQEVGIAAAILGVLLIATG